MVGFPAPSLQFQSYTLAHNNYIISKHVAVILSQQIQENLALRNKFNAKFRLENNLKDTLSSSSFPGIYKSFWLGSNSLSTSIILIARGLKSIVRVSWTKALFFFPVVSTVKIARESLNLRVPIDAQLFIIYLGDSLEDLITPWTTLHWPPAAVATRIVSLAMQRCGLKTTVLNSQGLRLWRMANTRNISFTILLLRLRIGHYRNVRGLGKSMVVFRLFEKLRYSNERSTIF